MIGVVLDNPQYAALLMELADWGSLRKLLDDEAPKVLGEPQFQIGLAIDMASGMTYLHGRRTPMLHHDLKSANVLLSSGPPGGRLVRAPPTCTCIM